MFGDEMIDEASAKIAIPSWFAASDQDEAHTEIHVRALEFTQI